MKISKKILAILLAVTLAFSVFAVSASAAGTPTGTEAMTVTITTDNETYGPEDAVQVRVTISSNYNVPSFRFPIMFDAEVYELPVIIGLKSYNTCASSGTVSYNTADTAQFIPEAYDPSAFGCVLFQWTASVTGGEIGHINNEAGELAFTFELKTKSSAVGKTGTIFIPEESDLFYYQAIENPADATSFYYLDAETCAMSFVPANAMVVGEPVDLIPNEDFGTPAVIDEENHRIYGLPVGLSGNAELKEYVKATGAKTVIRSTPTDYGYGTGTVVTLNVDAVPVKSYNVIIFGDVDGDAISDINDLPYVVNYSSGSTVCDDPVIVFAADLTNDGTVDVSDLPTFIGVASGSIVIDQTNPY